jgi:tyrosinase
MLFPAVLLRLLAFVTFSNLASAAALSPLLKHQIEEIASHNDHAEQWLTRRQSSANSSGYTVVTGIQGTGVQPRLEIRQLEKNADQWNVFLLGLNRFMRSNQSEKLSYYQVAGK